MALTIRSDQFQFLLQTQMLQFETEVEASVHRHWAHAIRGMDYAEVRKKIHRVLQAAQSYGMESQVDLLRYVNLVFLLGENFDNDPRFPWAAAFLHAPGISASIRMDQLYEWTQTLLKRGALNVPERR